MLGKSFQLEFSKREVPDNLNIQQKSRLFYFQKESASSNYYFF